MHLFERFLSLFYKQTKNKEDKYSILFNIGKETRKLSQKGKQLFKRLVDYFHHQRLEGTTDIAEQVRFAEQEIIRKSYEINQIYSKN